MATREQIQDVLDYVATCWHDAFSTTATPSDRQILVWANRHPLEVIAKALRCTGRKNTAMQGRGEDFTYMDKVRYASAVMCNPALALRRSASRRSQPDAVLPRLPVFVREGDGEFDFSHTRGPDL